MSEKNKGVVAMFLLVIQVAVLVVVVKYISEFLSVYWQLFTRMLLASAFIFILFRKKIRVINIIRSSKKDLGLMLLRSAAMYAGMILWVSAVPLTKLFTLTVFDSIPYSAILGILLMGESISKGKILWTTAAFSGVLIISIRGINSGLSFGLGELLLILSGILMAFRSVTVRWHHSKLNDWELTFVLLTISALMFFMTIIIRGEQFPFSLFTPTVAALTIAGGLLNVGTQFLTHYTYRRIDAILASTIWQTEAIFGMIFGFLFFLEIPNFRELAGSAVIIYSVYRMNVIYKKKI